MPLTDKELTLIIRALRAYADLQFIDYYRLIGLRLVCRGSISRLFLLQTLIL